MARKTLTPQEAAEMLGISTTTIYRLIKEDKLPVIKLGRKKLISKERLELLINDGYGIKEEE